MMSVVVVGEGQTEREFVMQILRPALAKLSVFVEPRLIPTSPEGRGGALSRQRVVGYLRDTLRERRDTHVTTLFDLYGLPSDFPGLATTPQDPLQRASAIEAALHVEVVRAARCRPDRFVPHIQRYEFEALLFSEVSRFTEEEPAWAQWVGQLAEARRQATSPEHINDGQNTHPSARLLLLPGYRKVQHGLAVSARIGLDRIRAECGHFGAWLSRIETLATRG